jgi:hypothetical protein
MGMCSAPMGSCWVLLGSTIISADTDGLDWKLGQRQGPKTQVLNPSLLQRWPALPTESHGPDMMVVGSKSGTQLVIDLLCINMRAVTCIDHVSEGCWTCAVYVHIPLLCC